MRLMGAVAAILGATTSLGHASPSEVFIPAEGLVVCAPGEITEARALALQHFAREMERFTGERPAQFWGPVPSSRPALVVGNRADLPDSLGADIVERAGTSDPDRLRQSYVLTASEAGGGLITAAGLGDDRTARDYLGLGYALADLIRRLDLRDGRWGFTLPAEPIVESPGMPQRTLYFANTPNPPPGLSFMSMTEDERRDYVDFLVAAGYSRLSFWQVYPGYLYPGSFESNRAANQRQHQVTRSILEYARRRGIEVVQHITPAYIDPALLPDDRKYLGVGWYTEKTGHGGICWAQPEGREMARKVARHEMEYYGPVDAYLVWFYDPAGCFCHECRPRQAEMIYDQLMVVADQAPSISPGAEIQAVLWPTWCFPDYEDQGIPFNAEQRDAFVKAFLDKCVERFGPRNITIVDSCEAPMTNIWNGMVEPERFKRNGFVYSLLGYSGESAYVVPAYRFYYQAEQLGEARDAGVEESTLYDHFPPMTRPVVYGFARTLYNRRATGESTIADYASSVAKGTARDAYIEMLTALDDLEQATDYDARDLHLRRAEERWKAVKADPLFFADREWMEGYMLSQRYYLEMARAEDNEAFDALYDRFIEEVGAIPLYKAHMTERMTKELCVNLHLRIFWRAPCYDDRLVGLAEAEAKKQNAKE